MTNSHHPLTGHPSYSDNSHRNITDKQYLLQPPVAPSSEHTYGVTLHDIQQAAARIAPAIHTTPILTCTSIDAILHSTSSDVQCVYKAELFQRTGAFKFRGATNAVQQIIAQQQQSHTPAVLVTHSSGNHAGALALAARDAGFTAHIVMPANSSQAKIDAVQAYGATIHMCEPNQAARQTMADEVIAEQQNIVGADNVHFVPPYSDTRIIAGQGTTALEFMTQLQDTGELPLDVLIVPCGGGGLTSGCCIAAKALQPSIRVFAAEPAAADDTHRSFYHADKAYQTNSIPPQTICDGLLTNTSSDLTWPIIRDHVDGVLVADDATVIRAMQLIMARMKLVVEPSTAVGLACLLSEQWQTHWQPALIVEVKQKRGNDSKLRIGIILEGGNVDLNKLPWCK